MLLDAFSRGAGLSRASLSEHDDGPHWQSQWLGRAQVLVGNYKDPVTGKALTVDDVLACSVMWRGMNLIASVIANTSIDLKRRVKNGNEVVTDHPILRVISKPTKTQTWYEYMETSILRYFLFGASYDEMLLDGNYQVAQLQPLDPWDMRLWLKQDGELEFHYTKFGGTYKFPQSKIHYIKGPSVDGYTGAAVADYAAKAIMTLRSFDEYALRFFVSDAVPPIILKVKGHPTTEAKRTIRDAWEKLHGGITNSRKVGVIGQDIDIEALKPSSNKDNELSAQQLLIIQHCARFLGLPNHALNDLTKSAFSNITGQSLEMLMYCFAPLMTKIQERKTLDLLTDVQRQSLYFEFDPYDLKWVDPKEQSEQLSNEVQRGVKTPNEARKRLGDNPHPDGDELMFNGAMTPLSLLIETHRGKIDATKRMADAAEKQEEEPAADDPKEEEKPEEDEKKKKEDEAKAAFEALFLESASRLITRRSVDVKKASKSADDLAPWLNTWYVEKYSPDAMQAFDKTMQAYLQMAGFDPTNSTKCVAYALQATTKDWTNSPATASNTEIFESLEAKSEDMAKHICSRLFEAARLK